MNRNRQRGMSSLGLLIVIGIAAFALLCIFKIGPLYLDNSFVGGSLEKMASEDLGRMSNSEIRVQLDKHFTVDNVRDISSKDVKIERKRNRVILTLDYEKRVQFLGNLDAVARFSHTVDTDDAEK